VIVVKVGGSLYDHPRLGPGLKAYLEKLPAPILVVAGGGRFADVVRHLDAVHHLGDDICHRLALHAMNLAGEFLTSLGALGGFSQPVPFNAVAADPDLPHTWEATSDSIAAWAAVRHGASRLILLKSIDIPAGTAWAEAAERGWLDRHFPIIMDGHFLQVEAVNFRRWLDSAFIEAEERINSD
jgi:5-(aminomethyl)-3-furanmethanol phosphate kinase